MEENEWQRATRLWMLFEWILIGGGLIFTLIMVSVSGLLQHCLGSLGGSGVTITTQEATAPERKSLKNKRVLIISNGQSELGRAVARRLRTGYHCSVISLSTCARGATHQEIICDLTNNLEARHKLQELWDNSSGVDLVVVFESQGRPGVVEETVQRIGTNIQQMINLLINLVPKMLEARSGGKFVIVREECHPRGRNEIGSEYEELLDQLAVTSERRNKNVGLLTLYCNSKGSAENRAIRTVNAMESGRLGSLEVAQNEMGSWKNILRFN